MQATSSAKLAQASDTAIVLNLLGIFIGLISLPAKLERYTLPIVLCAPLFFAIIIRSYKGLITVSIGRGNLIPSIFFGLAAVFFCLVVRALCYDIVDTNDLWPPAILLAAIPAMILIAGNKEIFRRRRSNIVQLLLIFTCCLVYGFTAVTIINCKYSAADSVIYHSTILSKSFQGGRNPRYNLLLSNWGTRKKPSWIIVSAKEYESIEIQDQVTIKQYSGLLRIRWFTVEY